MCVWRKCIQDRGRRVKPCGGHRLSVFGTQQVSGLREGTEAEVRGVAEAAHKNHNKDLDFIPQVMGAQWKWGGGKWGALRGGNILSLSQVQISALSLCSILKTMSIWQDPFLEYQFLFSIFSVPKYTCIYSFLLEFKHVDTSNFVLLPTVPKTYCRYQ